MEIYIIEFTYVCSYTELKRIETVYNQGEIRTINIIQELLDFERSKKCIGFKM